MNDTLGLIECKLGALVHRFSYNSNGFFFSKPLAVIVLRPRVYRSVRRRNGGASDLMRVMYYRFRNMTEPY